MCGSAMYVKWWQWMRRVQQMQAATDALPGAMDATGAMNATTGATDA
jgi:hypothetical protein